MAIWTFGSINIDKIYQVPHLPGPGETLASTSLSQELGGKGANQSIAARRAGSQVCHIGAVGEDGNWVIELLKSDGIDTTHVSRVQSETGHAIILVDSEGENSITLFPGANHASDLDTVIAALEQAAPNDRLLLQNETTYVAEAATAACSKGLSVIYSAAPFDIDLAAATIPHCDTLIVNEIEISQLEDALDISRGEIDVARLIVTKGGAGVDLLEVGDTQSFPALKAEVVDTTGAGDCFSGYFAAGLDQGMTSVEAVQFAIAASSLKVENHGTAGAIPYREDVVLRLNRP